MITLIRNKKGQFIKGTISPTAFKKGNVSWNKGLIAKQDSRILSKEKHPLWGKARSEEVKEKISNAKKGKPSGALGKHHSEEAKIKMAKAKIGNKNVLGKHWTLSEDTKRKMSEKTFSEDHKKKISKALKGNTHLKGKHINVGINHPNWKGGISFEPYSTDWTETLKRSIRERDNHICQECYQSEEETEYALSVHHIDYDKKNNDPSNLISLCGSCHTQTNFKRKDWINYFNQKLCQH